MPDSLVSQLLRHFHQTDMFFLKLLSYYIEYMHAYSMQWKVSKLTPTS